MRCTACGREMRSEGDEYCEAKGYRDACGATMKHKADWFRFLRERHLLILEWRAEGQSFELICHKLSMDPVQVQLISMTPLDDKVDRYDP